MIWSDLLDLHPLKINVGGKYDHHPRTRWKGYVSIDGRVGEGWSVRHQMPERFGLRAASVVRVAAADTIGAAGTLGPAGLGAAVGVSPAASSSVTSYVPSNVAV